MDDYSPGDRLMLYHGFKFSGYGNLFGFKFHSSCIMGDEQKQDSTQKLINH